MSDNDQKRIAQTLDYMLLVLILLFLAVCVGIGVAVGS